MSTFLDETTELRIFIKTLQNAFGDIIQIEIPTSAQVLSNDVTC
jgi:hypothetical protein